MQSTLTVKMDSSLVKLARARAKKRGIPVSALVEAGVRVVLREEEAPPFREEDLPPITRSLYGCIKGSRLDERDYRAYLEEKHR